MPFCLRSSSVASFLSAEFGLVSTRACFFAVACRISARTASEKSALSLPASLRGRLGAGSGYASPARVRALTMVAISTRTSFKIFLLRSLYNRRAAIAAMGLMTVACKHLSHTCVPFCPAGRLRRKAVKLWCGNTCRQVRQVQLPRDFVAHARQMRRSAWRVFHAEAVYSAAHFFCSHRAHGLRCSQVRHTR